MGSSDIIEFDAMLEGMLETQENGQEKLDEEEDEEDKEEQDYRMNDPVKKHQADGCDKSLMLDVFSLDHSFGNLALLCLLHPLLHLVFLDHSLVSPAFLQALHQTQ